MTPHFFDTRKTLAAVCLLGAVFALPPVEACAQRAAPADTQLNAEQAKIAAITQRLRNRDEAAATASPSNAPSPSAGRPVPPVILPAQERQPLGGDLEARANPSGVTGFLTLASPQETQPLGQTGGTGSGWMMNTAAALGLVIGLALFARWAYAKLGGKVTALPGLGGLGSNPSPLVEVLSRSMIAPKNHVLLLRVGGRVLVVSDTVQGTRTLTEITEPTEVADLLQAVEAAKPDSATGGFGKLLSRVSEGYDDPAEIGTDHDEHRIDRVRDTLTGLTSRLRFLNPTRPEAAAPNAPPHAAGPQTGGVS